MHAKVKEGNEEEETTRGASLRELQRLFKEHDKDEGYAGLRRIADVEDGSAVWTILKETEVTTQLEKRAKERREEERRHEKIFNAQTRATRATELILGYTHTQAKLQAKMDKEENKTNASKNDDVQGFGEEATPKPSMCSGCCSML